MRRLNIAVVTVVVLAFALKGLQQCKEEEETIVSAQLQSSCESCHSDNQALQTLAEPEDTGGSENAGEG